MNIKTIFDIIESSKTFDERVNEWKNLKELNGSNSADANNYYKDNILPEVIYKCAANTRERNYGRDLTGVINPDYMILTVGFSYEPLVLSISYIKPRKKILFLYTGKTEINKSNVVNFLKIDPKDYISREVDSNSMEKIDREIKEQYERWQNEYEMDTTDPQKNGRVAIDFTGGTKAMAAGATLAGAVIDTELIYVGSIYDDKSNQPESGTEYIELIKNPYYLYAVSQLKNRIITESYDRRDLFVHRIFAAQETVNRSINDLQKQYSNPEHIASFDIYQNKTKTLGDLAALKDDLYKYVSKLLTSEKFCNDKIQLENILKTAETEFKKFDLRLQELETIAGKS